MVQFISSGKRKRRKGGWFRDSKRHGLAARGVKTINAKIKYLNTSRKNYVQYNPQKFKEVKPYSDDIIKSIESKDIIANLFSNERGSYARVVNFKTNDMFEIRFVGTNKESAQKMTTEEFIRIVNMHLKRRAENHI